MSHRILLADDHELVRGGFRALIQSDSDLAVVGEVGDGREAVRAARELQAALVVMDVEMPNLNGIEAARQITAEVDGTKVLCLSMHSSPSLVKAAFEAGAAGYLLKDSAPEELVRAIRTVLAGRTYLSPALADAMAEALRAGPGAQGSAFTRLTGREREVLQLLAEGCSTADIASRLHMSTKTVYTHREQIMDKLDIRSVAGLTRYAIREGLTGVELPDPPTSDFF